MSDRLREERTGEEKGDGVAPRLFVIPLTISTPWLSPSETGATSAFPIGLSVLRHAELRF